MEFRIRKALEADIPAIRQAAEVAFPQTYREILTPEQIEYMMDWMYSVESLEEQFRHGHVYYVAEAAVAAEAKATVAEAKATVAEANATVAEAAEAMPTDAEAAGAVATEDKSAGSEAAAGHIAGYVSFERESERLFHLQKIYVLPSCQGSGLGRRLFGHALQCIKDICPDGCTVELNVNRHNKALDFYRHMGMRIAREGDFNIGGGFYMNDYIMAIEI